MKLINHLDNSAFSEYEKRLKSYKNIYMKIYEKIIKTFEKIMKTYEKVMKNYDNII